MSDGRGLNEEEKKVISEMIRGVWASGGVRSPEMAALLDGLLKKVEPEENGDPAE